MFVFPFLSLLQGFVAFLRLHSRCFRRIQDGPEFIEVAECLVSLYSHFFNHPDKYPRIVLLTAKDSNKGGLSKLSPFPNILFEQ